MDEQNQKAPENPGQRKPDAVLMNVSKVSNTDEGNGHLILQRQACAAMGLKPDMKGRFPVAFTKLDANWRFFRPTVGRGMELPTLNFPQDHILRGESRYHWFKVSDVLYHGFLRDEAVEHHNAMLGAMDDTAKAPPVPVQVQAETQS